MRHTQTGLPSRWETPLLWVHMASIGGVKVVIVMFKSIGPSYSNASWFRFRISPLLSDIIHTCILMDTEYLHTQRHCHSNETTWECGGLLLKWGETTTKTALFWCF